MGKSVTLVKGEPEAEPTGPCRTWRESPSPATWCFGGRMSATEPAGL